MVWMKLIWCVSFQNRTDVPQHRTQNNRSPFTRNFGVDIDVDFRQGASSQEAYHKGKDI